jgi:hypothetical protein
MEHNSLPRSDSHGGNRSLLTFSTLPIQLVEKEKELEQEDDKKKKRKEKQVE